MPDYKKHLLVGIIFFVLTMLVSLKIGVFPQPTPTTFVVLLILTSLIGSIEPDLDHNVSRKSWSTITLYYLVLFIILSAGLDYSDPQNQVFLLGGLLFILSFCLLYALILPHRNNFSHSIIGAILFSVVNAIIFSIIFKSEDFAKIAFMFHMVGYVSHLIMDKELKLGG